MRKYKYILIICCLFLISIISFIFIKQYNFSKKNIPEKIAMEFLDKVFSEEFIFQDNSVNTISDYLISSTPEDLDKVSELFNLEEDKETIKKLFVSLTKDENLANQKMIEFIKLYINSIDFKLIEKNVSKKNKDRVELKFEISNPVLKEEVFSNLATELDSILKEAPNKEMLEKRVNGLLNSILESLKDEKNIEIDTIKVTMINTKEGFKILSIIN